MNVGDGVARKKDQGFELEGIKTGQGATIYVKQYDSGLSNLYPTFLDLRLKNFELDKMD